MLRPSHLYTCVIYTRAHDYEDNDILQCAVCASAHFTYLSVSLTMHACVCVWFNVAYYYNKRKVNEVDPYIILLFEMPFVCAIEL